MKTVHITLGLISISIWFYLLYSILVRVEASELMWFLYWAYLPFATVTLIISRALEHEARGKK